MSILLDVSQNDYGGYLACTPISMIYAYVSLYCPVTREMLLETLEAGSVVWHTWGVHRGMMTVKDVMDECPVIGEMCSVTEYGGISPASLRDLWLAGSRDGSSGSITTVRPTGPGSEAWSGTGFSYGLQFDGDSVYVFDPHGPQASLCRCEDFDEFVGLMYKGGKGILMYSAILLHPKKK